MKKDLGPVMALYPMPLVVVGAYVGGKPSWTLAGHVGIIGHDRILVSLAKPHYINGGIKESKALSVNIVDEGLLAKADYVGCVSGNNTDKSEVFECVAGEDGAPIISQSPLVMECKVVDVYETPGFESFICSIGHTYAEADVLNAKGRIDYGKLKPILFEMPTYEYLATGEKIAACMSFGKNVK